MHMDTDTILQLSLITLIASHIVVLHSKLMATDSAFALAGFQIHFNLNELFSLLLN